jgi:4,5-dihydroxyphthalate decarboxylase
MDFLTHGANVVSGARESSMMQSDSSVVLYSLLGNHPGTEALKAGRVFSSSATFEYADVKVINTQFKAMMRDLKYDFGELAIATYLQGFEYGKPYVLLPATIMGRNQHHTIFYNADREPLTPRDLNGRRVGVRAYAQTTGTWVRGVLAEEYDVDLQSLTWVTFEDPHLAEFVEPANVRRAAPGKALKQMLLDGEIDAAILGDVAEEGPLRHLIPNHSAEGQRWARAHGGVAINHMAVVRTSIAQSRPDVVREIYRLLTQSRAAVTLPTGLDDPLRFGVAATRQSLEQMVAYSFQQGLISRCPTADELFADAVRILGADAE